MQVANANGSSVQPSTPTSWSDMAYTRQRLQHLPLSNASSSQLLASSATPSRTEYGGYAKRQQQPDASRPLGRGNGSRVHQNRHTSHEDTDVQDIANATTLMLCNIPCRAKLDEIIDMVSSLGFENLYDFLYAPGATCAYGRSRNLGYAFVNFLSADEARRFAVAFNGYCFEGRASSKKGIAKIARVQGFDENVMRADLSKCVLPGRQLADVSKAQGSSSIEYQ
jgi:hypothetical protein